jgi:hypothetical protein
MKKLDELSAPDSCLNKAADDEPLFVLRANDELAPDVVRHWVGRYDLAKGGPGRMTAAQNKKCAEAMALARQMEAWRERSVTGKDR